MKIFGLAFITVGVGLVALSARAIADPESPIGWSRWTDDPWSQGIFAGASLALAGLVLIALVRFLTPTQRRFTARVLGTFMAAVVGFALMAPFGVTHACGDGDDFGFCETQGWTTITGFTFDGEPNSGLGIGTSLVLGGAVWLLTGPSRRLR